MAYILSQLFVVALFRQSAVIQPTWACTPTSFGIAYACGGDVVNDVCSADSIDWCTSNCGNTASIAAECSLEESCFCTSNAEVECENDCTSNAEVECESDNCPAVFDFGPAEEISVEDYCVCEESPPELVYVISHAILVALFSSVPLAILLVAFTVGYKKNIASDKLKVSTKVLRLAITVEMLAGGEDTLRGIFAAGTGDNGDDQLMADAKMSQFVKGVDLLRKVVETIEVNAASQSLAAVYGWVEFLDKNLSLMNELILAKEDEQLLVMLNALVRADESPSQSVNASFPSLDKATNKSIKASTKVAADEKRATREALVKNGLAWSCSGCRRPLRKTLKMRLQHGNQRKKTLPPP
jgi:hypothetical protein